MPVPTRRALLAAAPLLLATPALAARQSGPLVQSEWFVGWTVRKRQGWEKDLSPSTRWTHVETAGYAGNTVEYTHQPSGPNFIYLTLPAAYYRGRKLALVALGTSVSGEGDGFRLAINTDEAEPTDMRPLGKAAFQPGDPRELSARATVPADAAHLHIGLRCDGRVGVSHVLAYGAWAVEGDALPLLGNS